jgi:hypothetical protein
MIRIALFLAFVSSAAMAQDVPRLSNGTPAYISINRSGPFVVNIPPSATVGADGEVKINWERVERAMRSDKTDPMTLAYSRLMLSIRDKTYKPLD